MKLEINLTKKQGEAWQVINDTSTTELLFGGSAGSGKSVLICEWQIEQCVRFPGVRFLLAREELKQLKATTLVTLFECFRNHKLKKDSHWNYNSQTGVITFYNESEIILSELRQNPSDPEFQDLGSLELTGAGIDEGGEISAKAFTIVSTRVGRAKNNEYGIKPMVVIGSNPIKGYLYREFYKPAKEKRLEHYRAFVPALPKDNPYLPANYVEQLKRIKDKTTRERLLHGNWEYDDDPARMIEYDAIIDMFTNVGENGEKYITVDVARLGGDKIVLYLWQGLQVYGIIVMRYQTLDKTSQIIRDTAAEESIPYSHIAVDEDGVGAGVVDMLKGVKGFVANSSALPDVDTDDPNVEAEKPNFANLKSQCAFKLADYVNLRKIGIKTKDEQTREWIVEEFEVLKNKDMDKERKLRITTKDEQKEELGRSPDFLDAAIMRMMFELKTPQEQVSAMHIHRPRQEYQTTEAQGDFMHIRRPRSMV